MICVECTEKCHSNHHICLCTSAITKCTDDQFKQLVKLCINSLTGVDKYGRNVLHVAASMGKTNLVEWLIDEGLQLNVCDLESNWTALHRSLFYGYISTARLLIASDAGCLNVKDNEGRTPFDLIVADRQGSLSYSPQNSLYSWGENVNFTLGQTCAKTTAESVVYGKDEDTGVADVVMCKYHSLLLTPSGQVLSCGHGFGGRLGHGNEQTLLKPKFIQALKNDVVTMFAAAKDHSVFLTDKNIVYTCGLNDCHQLGHDSPKILQPKALKFKPFKEHALLGVCAGRFHTVVYASDALFTFGLNAGQLGHNSGENYQITPRLVSGINYKTMTITRVVCSDAATLCNTKQGDLILITEFKIKKIAAGWTLIKDIAICGGKLDHRPELEVLKEFGGSEISIGILNSSEQLFLWRSSDPTLRRVNYPGLAWLSPRAFSISKTCLLVASSDGQVFKGSLPAERRKSAQKKALKKEMKDFSLDSQFRTLTLTELSCSDETCYVDLSRVKGVHRATKVYMDPKAQNFMTIQSLPNQNLTMVPEIEPSKFVEHISRLYNETTANDSVHDVVLISGSLSLPAHRFILSSRSKYFHSLFLDNCQDSEHIFHVDVSDLGNADILLQVIKFIYTHTCDLVTPDCSFTFVIQPIDAKPQSKTTPGRSRVPSNSGMSAYAMYQSQQDSVEDEVNVEVSHDPIKMVKDMAKALGVQGLSSKCENVYFQNGKVCVKDRSKLFRRIPFGTFNRRDMSHLFDMKLESGDGVIFNCHKCVLTSRMEYFNSMLTSGWMESNTESRTIKLPMDGPVLNGIFQYVYTDDSKDLRSCKDVELLCNVLVIADQLLEERLKQICQVVLCELLTLKNVAEILEFCTFYNAEQLKLSCQQFVSLNLPALLETRSLDIVSDEVMEELDGFYRGWVTGMCRRKITPWDEPPTREELETLPSLEEVAKPEVVSKAKPRRRRSSKSMSEEKSNRRDSIGDGDAITEIPSAEISVIDLDESMDQLMEEKDESPGGVFEMDNTESDNRLSWSGKGGNDAAHGLREIMEEQSSKASGDHNADMRSHSAKKKKLSQKERKRLAQLEIEAQRVSETPVTPDTPVSPPTLCPWAQSPPNSAIPSLRDVMSEQKSLNGARSKTSLHTTPLPSSNTPRSGNKGSKGKELFTWGLSARGSRNSISEKTEEDSPPEKPIVNPWTKRETTTVNQSLRDIVKEEMNETVTLDKTKNKPLHVIQLEEKAINELTKFYVDANPPDVKISVERLTKVVATPTWAAHQ